MDVREATHPSDPLVYRVAREAVRNAQAHAEARSVTISLVTTGPAGASS